MSYILQILCFIAMIISWGIMGIEILENGMKNLTLIEICAYITLAGLIGNLICALYRLYHSRKK